ncbi:hypothetical protein [Streptomyces griseorubiginosus]|uniref:hypothetical protein n=1 Tax=Streptomyces griseorubiginosus TaxID=67304 RepID=UPI0033DF9522
MSTTTSTTDYRFAFYLRHGGSEAETAFFTLTTASGMDDASALALANAMKNVAWPTGTVATVSVERNATTSIHYDGAPTADPPVFI